MLMKEESKQNESGEEVYSRSKEIQGHIQALSGRDTQLLSIALLIMIIVSSGLLAVAYPDLKVSSKAFRTDARFLPQLIFGLIVLIVLFNVYIITQKKELGSTRRRLIQELLFSERTQIVSFIDPVTLLYNHRAMEQMLAHEVARSLRHNSPLSFVVLKIANFGAIRNRLGAEETDYFLYDAANLVKNTFRGSDVVFRYRQDKFLVAMPDTAEHQVDHAIDRLDAELIRYNTENEKAELSVTHGVAQYASGFPISDALTKAERKVSLEAAPIL